MDIFIIIIFFIIIITMSITMEEGKGQKQKWSVDGYSKWDINHPPLGLGGGMGRCCQQGLGGGWEF